MSHEDQPTARTPRAHQVTGSRWMAGRARGLICDPPGTGKTNMSLMAAKAAGLPTIVVCPAVAIGVWEAEIAGFDPTAAIRVQDTTKPLAAPTSNEYVITTYDRANAVPDGQRFGVILDEVHLVKNPTSGRHKRVKKLTLQARGYLWGLTGTPILRDPDDLWGILSVLGIERQTYKNRELFLRHWNGQRVLGELRWGKPRADAWTPLTPLMLHRPRSSMFDLPARTRETWALKLKTADHKRFQEVAERFPAEDDQWETWATGGELAAALASLSVIKASLALDPIRELEPSATNPVAVFCAHRAAAKLLAQELGWPAITGETPADARTQIAEAFQAGLHCGVVCTIQAAGLALTLTRAATCVFVSQTFVAAANSQAEDRLYRIGQLREVRTIFCRSDSALEKQIDLVLRRKVGYLALPEVG